MNIFCKLNKNNKEKAMRKITLLLVFTILFGYCFLSTSCSSNTATNTVEPTKEIKLTKENFNDYFTIEVDSDIDVTKHGGNVVLGVYIAPTYTAVADIDVDAFAKVPLNAYNVSITLKVTTGSIYWNEQIITLNLSSNGSANKSFTVITSDEKDILFESDCMKDFYVSIISVEGTIKTN